MTKAVSVIQTNAAFLSEVAHRVEDLQKAQVETNALIAGIKRMELQQWIEENMSKPLIELFQRFAGRPGYFKTTRQEDADTIRAVMTEAFVNGLNPVGEEFMIIHGRLYIHAKGYRRLLKSIGCTVRTRSGAIERKGSRALVEYEVSFTWQGKTDIIRYVKAGDFDTRINVKVDNKQDEDAFLGKAERKALRNVWTEVCGMEPADVDTDEQSVSVDVVPMIEADSEVVETDDTQMDGRVDIDAERESQRQFFIEQIQNIDLDAADACGEIKKLMQHARAHADMGELTEAAFNEIRDIATMSYKACTNDYLR